MITCVVTYKPDAQIADATLDDAAALLCMRAHTSALAGVDMASLHNTVNGDIYRYTSVRGKC